MSNWYDSIVANIAEAINSVYALKSHTHQDLISRITELEDYMNNPLLTCFSKRNFQKDDEISIYAELTRRGVPLSDELIKFYLVYNTIIDEYSTVTQTGTNNNYYTYQGNGVARLKGATFDEGFENKDTWEMSFDYSYPEGMRYVGLIVLADLDNRSTYIGSWEGGNILGLAGDLPSGASINSNPVVTTYNTLHVRRTGSNTLELWKNNDTSNKVTYTWNNLSNIEYLTIGARNNGNSTSYGSVFLKNWKVTY